MKPIVLIGPMGAGKTTLGKKLAKSLGITFNDTDKLVEKEHGPISTIFESSGEEHFRDLEHGALVAALSAGGVISTGGGIVLREDNRNLLRQALVILLDTTSDAVLSRINLKKRPLLRDNPQKWQEIYDARISIYRELADEVLFTGNRPIKELVAELESRVSNHEL